MYCITIYCIFVLGSEENTGGIISGIVILIILIAVLISIIISILIYKKYVYFLLIYIIIYICKNVNCIKVLSCMQCIAANIFLMLFRSINIRTRTD